MSKTCPRCRTELHELTVGKLRIDMCRSCEGSWYDEEELAEVLSLDRPLEAVGQSELAPILVRDKTDGIDLEQPAPCPVCGAQMDRYMLDSAIFMDRCNEHGVWLDDGELTGIVDHYVQSTRVSSAVRERALQLLKGVKGSK